MDIYGTLAERRGASRSQGRESERGSETSYRAVNHTDSLERVNVTVREICLGEEDAWKNRVRSGTEVSLK